MKTIIYILITNLLSLGLATLSGLMVYWDKPNYGWVIFAAILCFNYPNSKLTKKRNTKKL